MRQHLMMLILVGVAFGASLSVVAANPELTVRSPQGGETINGMDVTVAFEATDFSIVPSTVPLADAGLRPDANRDGEGHVHFVLDLMPIIVWESTEPYTLTDVPPGEHLLMVELVNNDHSPLSPPVSQQIRFRSNSDQLLANTGSAQNASNGVDVILVVLAGTAVMSAGFILRRKPA